MDAADRQRAARRGVPERWRMHGGRGVVNTPAADSDPQMQREYEGSSDGPEPRATGARGGCGTTGHAFSLSMPGASRLGATIVGANVRHLFDGKSDYGEWQR